MYNLFFLTLQSPESHSIGTAEEKRYLASLNPCPGACPLDKHVGLFPSVSNVMPGI